MQLPFTVLALVAKAVFALSIFDSLGDSFGVPGKNASYDYVVIGGGTGGLTIAARLAEDRNASVAVIEAGGVYQIDNGNGRLATMAAMSFSGQMLRCLQHYFWSLRQSGRRRRPRNFSTTDRLGLRHDTPARFRKS
jgi:choline dehydrogenase-like flavoprotein